MKINNEERDYILDSSLISTTFCQQRSNKTLYNAKLINCNGYCQLYTFSSDKSIKIEEKEKKQSKLDISVLDTDLLSKIDNNNNCLSNDIDLEKYIRIQTQLDRFRVFNTSKQANTNKNKEIDLKNIMRSKLQCQRLAKCNSDIWETFITLTFADNITDIKIANKEFNKFISKIKRVYKDFKYICVPEFQKRGAIHYHLLTNISINNEKLIYRQLDNNKYFHIKYWSNGFDKVDNIKGDIKKIIGYISKYMTKDIDNRLFGKHRYMYSQNLNKPAVFYLDLSNEKHIDFLNNILDNKKLIYHNEYLNEFFNEKINFQEFLIENN